MIIGNPPYSIGQKSANDDAQNLSYPHLDKRIEDTYVKYTTAIQPRSLYDSYVKAFRWGSDRISQIREGGILSFISNGSWLDGLSQDGMRKCLQDEFTSIYIFNLRGNQRTSGELSRKEGGKIFGSGSRTPITITFLVKNPAKRQDKATIFYHDIGDYLTREQKLKIIRDFHSIKNVEWKEILPNEKNDWINLRDGLFDSLIALVGKNNVKSFFNMNPVGIVSARDSWVYGFSKKSILSNVVKLVDTYYKQKDIHNNGADTIINDETLISWSVNLRNYILRNTLISYNGDTDMREANYRPFTKQQLMYNIFLIERPGKQINIYPKGKDIIQIAICGSSSSKEFSVIMSDRITDFSFTSSTQCFPLYWYEENKNKQKSLFDDGSDDDYIRRDGITDWILKEVRNRYKVKSITKEMIFYYVYGLLHSKEYRERFAADLKKSLPRIPIVEDVNMFMDFYMYGKKLADLHLNYEDVAPYPDVVVKGDRKVKMETRRDPATGGFVDDTTNPDDYNYFRVVDKMRFKSKEDKSTIIYNGNITIENIPAKAYEYIVNGKSAIEWIVERYAVTQDKKSLIKNDANDWSKEHHKPRYILDLLLSVINVSVQTVDIVNKLPKLKFD